MGRRTRRRGAGPGRGIAAAALLWLAAGGTACAGRFGPEPSAPAPATDLTISVPDVIRWEEDGPRRISVHIVNATEHPAAVAGEQGIAVEVHRSAPAPSCRAGEDPPAAPRRFEALAPGEARTVSLDLSEACRALPPGEYWYELRYPVSPPRGAEGTVRVVAGRIQIAPRGQAVDVPARRREIAPPGPGDPTAAPLPAPPGGPVTPPPLVDRGGAVAPAHPEAVQACVARELSRRGLNAYGDPAATTYPAGPPVAEEDRIEHVLDRHPDVATACRVRPGPAG
jgi:hypothetical protein